MVELSGIWTSVNEKCEGIVQAVKLDGVFADYNLPPVLLPAAIVLIILVLLLMSSGGAPPEPKSTCGDGYCQMPNENRTNCAKDCVETPRGKTVTVQLDKTPACQVTVKLYTNATTPFTQKAARSKFDFADIVSDTAYAQVDGPGGITQKTPSTSLKQQAKIDVVLDSKICDTPPPSTLTLFLTIKDSETLQPINGVEVSIAEMNYGTPGTYPVKDKLVSGATDVQLTSGKSYAVFAVKEGYDPHDGTSDPVTMSGTKGINKAITMAPVSNQGKTGDVEVCVKKNGDAVTTGLVGLQGTSDLQFVGDLSNVDPATEPTSSGCYVFKAIPAGNILTATMQTPPEGCTPKATMPITVQEAKRQLVEIALECGIQGSGFVKVKVIGGTNLILTQNATVTIWTDENRLVPGTGQAASLAQGSAGYTEEVALQANASFYAWVRGVSGYQDVKSALFSVKKGEHKALDVRLNATGVVSKKFLFSGVTSPKSAPLSQPFKVAVAQILYGDTALTGSTANLEVAVGESKCAVSYDGVWKADCVAPALSGEFAISFKATYNKELGTYSLPLQSREYRPGDGLTILPLFSTHGEPPVELFYDIRLNDTPVTELTAQNLTVTYTDSPGAYPGEIGELEYLEEEGYWTLTADVPFRGAYSIDANLEVFSGGYFYNGSYFLEFTSSSNSKSLKAETYLSEDLLPVGTTFDVEAVLKFKDKIVYGLDILELYMNGVYYSLQWEPRQNVYSLAVSSPSDEVCNLQLRLMVKEQEVSKPVMLHVIDTGGTKSATCPLDRQASCDSIEEVRKCLENKESRVSFYPEDQLATCITSGCPFTYTPECPTDNKGDIVKDCQLTEDDAQMGSEYLSAVGSQADRNKLAPCLDMDNDGDADEDDTSCLSSMVSTKWFGDVDGGELSGDVCEKPLKGGFCFDIEVSSKIPGDVAVADEDLTSEDEDVMTKIVETTSAGVTPSEEVLEVADFNQDGNIDNTDLECLKKFFLIDFDTAEILPSSQPMPSECLKILKMGCEGERGDLNTDGEIDLSDLIILKLLVEGYVRMVGNESNTMLTCEDIDKNLMADDNDVTCLNYYLSGDEERWMSCLGCAEDLPTEAESDYEICEDGFDNNCDGLTDDQDPSCKECGSGSDCKVVLDSDGGTSLGVSDGSYKVCAKIEASAGSAGSAGYSWVDIETVNEKCKEAKDWTTTYMCGSTLFTCVFDYPVGFKMSDDYTTKSGDDGGGAEMKFAWLEGSGNIGPLVYVHKCGDPECLEGWEEIDNKHGGTCEKKWDWETKKKTKAVWCRWKYDMCEEKACGESGKKYESGDYSSSHYEECTVKTECGPAEPGSEE